MLNDVCSAYADNLCSEYSQYNKLEIIQTYAGAWYVTDLKVTEEHNRRCGPHLRRPGRHRVRQRERPQITTSPSTWTRSTACSTGWTAASWPGAAAPSTVTGSVQPTAAAT
ncbi:MAG: hypothetical protein R2854_04990 [Caldilineaceae bacterium]